MSLTIVLDHNTGNIHKSPKSQKRKVRKYYDEEFYWFDGPSHHAEGEEALWRAVITQAMLDAVCTNRKQEFLVARKSALRWLTTNSPDFIDVCICAGLDPDHVRVRAKKLIANPTAWRTQSGKSKRYVERKAMRERRKQKRREISTDADPKTPAGISEVIPFFLKEAV